MNKRTFPPVLTAGAVLTLLLSATVARADYKSTVLGDAPSAYYRLSEWPTNFPVAVNGGSGGAGLNGEYQFNTKLGLPGALAGDANVSATFGPMARVEVPYSAQLNPGGAFTIECWAMVTNGALSTSYRSPVSSRDSGGTAGSCGYILYASSGNKWSFWTGVKTNWVTLDGPTVVTNSWVHVVGTHEDLGTGTNRLYINGVLVGTKGAPTNFVPNQARPLRIGAGANESAAGDYYFPGRVDEVAFYGGQLTDAQIQAHYAAGTNLAPAVPYSQLVTNDGAVAYWRLDDSGTVQVATNIGSLGAAGNGAYWGSAATLSPGKAGAVGDSDLAMGFNGQGTAAASAVGARVEVPVNAALNPPTNFSIEAWTYIPSIFRDYQAVLVSRDNTASVTRGYALFARTNVSTGPTRWEFWTGRLATWNVCPSTNAVQVGAWNHVVGTYDGTYQLLYVNGDLVGAFKPLMPYAANFISPLRIASTSESARGDNFLNGTVDEAAIYGTALPQASVFNHYAAAFASPPSPTTVPYFTLDPLPATNQIGARVTLDAIAYGSVPMQYQWLKDGAPVPDATNFVLVIPSATYADSGFYQLGATNAAGGAVSSAVYVEILPPGPPVITADLPANVTVYPGGSPKLEVKVSGSAPFTYLWSSNGVPLPEVTGSSLTLNNVQPPLSGSQFSVLVTNAYGSAPSAVATIMVAALNPASYASVVLAANPLSYWRFGEDPALTTTALDCWGGNNGQYVNAFHYTPGALGLDDDGAMYVNGANCYMVVSNGAPYNFSGTNAFTLMAWARPETLPTTGVQRVFSTRSYGPGGNAQCGYGFGFLTNAALRFTAFGVVDVNFRAPTVAGQWQHIAAVRSGTSVVLYHNGVAVGTNNNVVLVIPSGLPLRLGGNSDITNAEEPLNGQIDEAAVFTTALSASQIKAIYESRNGARPNIVQAPQSFSVYAGGTALFAAQAAGTPPLSYQWSSNTVTLADQTNTFLLLTNVTTGATYSLTVTNLAGATNVSATLTVTTPSGYASPIMADGPVAYWRLNDPPGPLVHDMWGGHEGTTNGGVTFQVPGPLKNDSDTAMNFDGSTTTKVVVPWAAELNPAAFSVEAWARVTGGLGNYRAVVSSRDLNQGYILYAASANNWQFWTRATGVGWQTLVGPAIVDGEWTHVAATFDGTNKTLYVNGAPVASQVNTNYEQNLLRAFRIGAGNNEGGASVDYNFPGDIDEVVVYNKALGPDRIGLHYAYGKYSTNTAPFMVQEPVTSQSIVAGGAATITAQAAGSPVLGYQWFKDGTNLLAGQTMATLTLNNAYYTDAGAYSVQVVNGVGATNSQPSLLAVGAPPTFACLTNDLVLHLKFDGNYTDSSGRTNDAFPTGSPVFVSGKLGQAVHVSTDTNLFSYNYVWVTDPNFDLSFDVTNSFSVAFWARYSGTPDDLPMVGNAYHSTYNKGWVLSDNGGRLVWTIYGSATGSAVANPVGPVINDDNWHHVVLTVDRATALATTFVDGREVDSRSIAGIDNLITGYAITLGQDGTGAYAVNGMYDLDDVGIWRRALTSYEAVSIYGAAQNAGQSFDVYGPVKLSLIRQGAELELIWQAGTLEAADEVNGTYTTVRGASAPYFKVAPGTANKFYRVKL